MIETNKNVKLFIRFLKENNACNKYMHCLKKANSAIDPINFLNNISPAYYIEFMSRNVELDEYFFWRGLDKKWIYFFHYQRLKRYKLHFLLPYFKQQVFLISILIQMFFLMFLMMIKVGICMDAINSLVLIILFISIFIHVLLYSKEYLY